MRMRASVGIAVKWAKRGHRPVHILLKGDAEHVKRLVYTVAPKMGTQIIIGPQVQPPTYASARCVAEAAVQSRGDPESPPG
eukprot:7195572-Pyramimonas_sp.AAC.1